MTGIATAVYENRAHPLPAGAAVRQREQAGLQLAGAEALAGTHPYTLARRVEALRINRFLYRMTKPVHLAAFLENEEAAFEWATFNAEERDLLRRRD